MCVAGQKRAPATVVDRYDLDLADVYSALPYDHDRLDESEERRSERDELVDDEDISRPDCVALPSA